MKEINWVTKQRWHEPNMTAFQNFKKYYLPWLIGMALLFGIRFVIGLTDDDQRQRVTSVQGILLLIVLTVGTAITCGGIYHWFYAVYRPKRLIKLFNRIKNIDLQALGLKIDEGQKIFSGYYKGYFLTISCDSTPDKGEFVRTHAFVTVKETQVEEYKRLQTKFEFNADDGLFWFTNKTKMTFGRAPKVDKLRADINDLVDALRFAHVEPLEMTN